ncbi:MAG: dTMP kinase, partial [Burkholderiaceae bacterium]
MASSGLFISFEGIDGAGKSTHIGALERLLCEAGRDVVTTREPGGTALAESLRALVLHQRMDPLTEALLMFAARRDHLRQVIQPALEQGKVVLCDRFSDSSFAYQGGGQGLPLEVLQTLERWVQGNGNAAAPLMVQPDLTLWFDLSPAVAAVRLSSARSPDRFESQGAEFFSRVAAGYARRAADSPQRFARVDAGQDPAVVWDEVHRVMRAR